MEVIAKARFIRMSPRKVRLVAGLVRGLDLAPALAQLRFWRKAAARPVRKVIESAAANAENNFKMDPSRLFIKAIMVDVGPSLKRWRARAFGRAAAIKKHTCHITVLLDERKGPAGAAAALVKPAAAAAPAAKKPGVLKRALGRVATKKAPATKAAKAK